MSRFVKFFVCAFAVVAVAVAGVVQAATYQVQLDTWQDLDGDPNNDVWTVTAWDLGDGSDNDGIAGFNIDVVGGFRAELDAPRVLQEGFPPGNFNAIAGFTIFDAPDGSFDGDGPLFAGQDTAFGPNGTMLYGVGQGAGGTGAPPPFVNVNVPWDDPVLLGHGTGDWQAVSLLVSANINVFEEGSAGNDGRGAVAAEVMTSIVRNAIPEPASFALLGIAMLGVFGLRRKLG